MKQILFGEKKFEEKRGAMEARVERQRDVGVSEQVLNAT
jgi:hypothetical protein